MLSAVLVAAVVSSVSPSFCPPQPWALGFAAPPRMPMVGDVDDDGYADLIVVYPQGDCIVDVNLTVEGVKSGGGFQGLTQWGKDCQAAVAGELDDQPGADVVGIFEGSKLRLAGAFKDRKFKDSPDWAKLPKTLKEPALAVLPSGVLAWSKSGGEGYLVRPDGSVGQFRLPKGLVWVGSYADGLVAQTDRGIIHHLLSQPSVLRLGSKIGEQSRGSRPAVSGSMLVFGQTLLTPVGTATLAKPELPDVEVVRGIGDFDKDGDLDIVEFRYGSEHHTAHAVLLRRQISEGETDPDHDGLTNEQEQALGTDPLNPDTDNDALLDGWEVGTYRDLDMKAMGCDPKVPDVICLISRFETVDEAKTKAELQKAIEFYKPIGLNLHLIYLDPVKGDDTKSPWWTNRNKFRPEKWRGIVHWMQVTPGGGGQADQLGDGGSIGEGAMWAVFVHEFGHQMGLNHEGFWPNFLCPIYTSLMNYAYSYSLDDDREKIKYSDGSLKDYVLRETNLDETIPLPYEKVKFLEKGPYRFRLKPNGNTTLIDWNWNGVFGEKNVRADINYSYSTNAGRRDDVGKAMSSPWLFTHQKKAYVLYGSHEQPNPPQSDPSISAEKPGRLMLRRLVKPFEWEPPVTLESGGLIGDPVAVSHRGRVHLFYQTAQGIVTRALETGRSGFRMSEPKVVDPNPALVPSASVLQDQLVLLLWNPEGGKVTYRFYGKDGKASEPLTLDAASTNPVGLCEDVKTGEAIVGMAQNQDDKRPNRWQIRRYRLDGGRLRERSMEWIEGKDGQSRGTGRITVLHDPTEDRVYFYGRGMTDEKTKWSCTYVAHQIADKTVKGGWLVKRFYDEWTQSRSAPAAAWFDGDVIWSYRWVDGGNGPTDNNLHVGYRALGIEDAPMGDHDDIGYIKGFGIRHSLISLGR